MPTRRPPSQPQRNAFDLTPPELEALRAVSHGLTYAQSADLYCISLDALNSRLDSARLKLAAKNTPHAVAIALRLRLID